MHRRLEDLTAGGGRWPLRAWLHLGLAASLAGACATTSPGNRSFEDGDYTQAAVAFEKSLKEAEWLNEREDRVLYRLALIYASSDSPYKDPDRAQALFQRLVDDHADSPYGLAAGLILELQQKVADLREAALQTERKINSLLRQTVKVQRGSDRMEAEAGAHEESIQKLSRQVRRLQAEIERLAAQVADREAELQRIKEIDLAKPP
jgi:tetratricopeptide (TPR) repeat protein